MHSSRMRTGHSLTVSGGLVKIWRTPPKNGETPQKIWSPPPKKLETPPQKNGETPSPKKLEDPPKNWRHTPPEKMKRPPLKNWRPPRDQATTTPSPRGQNHRRL